MGVFKEYDVRGIYGTDIDTDFAYRLGRAFAAYFKGDHCMIGYDARLHSGQLYQAIGQGISDGGKKVEGIGLTSTPCLHYLQIAYKYDAGVMVTASHNPPEYHGFKFFNADGGSVSLRKGLSEIQDMLPSITGKLALQMDFLPLQGDTELYTDFLTTVYKMMRLSKDNSGASNKGARKIVIDISNGSAGSIFDAVKEKCGLDLILINKEPDGRFPSHNPNPLEEKSREQVAAAVREHNADAGAIIDGDGDRVVFVDEMGESINNSFIAAFFAEGLLKAFPCAPVVYDLISSRALPEYISRLGGVPLVSKVGYTNLYDKMKENNAVFGAETSGHFYFRVSGRYYTESAAYAVLLFIKLLSSGEEKISSLISPLKEKYFRAPDLNAHVADKESVMNRVREHFKAFPIETLDGISIDCGDYWFNLRPSNTEPLLRLTLEAKSREIAMGKLEELKKLIEA